MATPGDPGKRDQAPGPRTGRGFRAAGAAVRGPVTVAAARVGFAVPDVLLRWPEVVGDAVATLCQPVRISHASGPGLGGTLLVRATGAGATEVQHLAPQIVERVNSFFGYRAVTRLRLTQAEPAAPGFADAAAPFDGPGPDPTGALAREAARLAGGVLDPDLRAALTRLGAEVLARRGRG